MPGLELTWFAFAVVAGALVCAPLTYDARLTVVCVVGGFLAAVFRSERRHIRVAVLLALAVSSSYATIRTHFEPQVNESRTMRFSGIVRAVQNTPEGLHEYHVVLQNSLRVLVVSRTAVPLGAGLVIRGRLEPFDGPRNPGDPSERDIQREAGLDGRIASATILSVHSPRRDTLGDALSSAKAWAGRELQRRLGDPDAAIVAGELWGARDTMPPDLRTAFQETGTVHVLVTAGLHVGLIAALVVALLNLCEIPRAATCVLAIVAVWIFAAVSGLHIPALRAASMATALLLARACGRATLSWNALAAAAIVVVVIDPRDVGSASFWLSFCCVGAIFSLAGPIDHALQRYSMPHRMREAVALTVATQLGTWPITAAVFLQFTPYALVGNLAVVPCVPATMALGALQLVLAPAGPLAQAAANLNGWILAWTVGAVRMLAGLPGATLVMTPAPVWALVAYEAALCAAAPLVRRGAATLVAGLIITTTSYVIAPPTGFRSRLHIFVLDVGQADAIVIETPAHHVILVDAGGRLERGSGGDSQAEQIGERIVVPFLLRQGIHGIDAMVVSHPHGDHVGGCAPVLRKLHVTELADGGQTYGGHAYHDCLDTAGAGRVPILYPRAGMVWRTDDGVRLTFIGPSLPFIGGKNAINDNSIAFILQYANFRMLFTGDAGVAAERRFLDEGIDLHADVLKVGHHGSAYSSSREFIAAVHPRDAIISVGRHNLFGHPAPSTLATLLNIGASIYRTDENGAVRITVEQRPPWYQIAPMLPTVIRD